MSREELEELTARGIRDDLQALQVLRNPHCSFAIAVHIAAKPELAQSTGVRELVCTVRGLPLPKVLDLLATLPWLSLMNLAQNPRTPPQVRRHAETKLIQRIDKLTLGERIAAARRAHRTIVPHLAHLGEPMVVEALLDNPRLTGEDVIGLLHTPEPPSCLYAALIRHPRWGPRHEIRFAVARSKGAPVPLAVSALAQMPVPQLRLLAKDPGIRPEIRHAAHQLGRRRVGRGQSAR